MAYMHLFCGMFVEHYNLKGFTGNPASLLGIGVIMPADTIIDVLLSDDRRKARAEDDRAFLSVEPGGGFEAASSAEDDGDEFERFEELTDKLLRVPKDGTRREASRGLVSCKDAWENCECHSSLGVCEHAEPRFNRWSSIGRVR